MIAPSHTFPFSLAATWSAAISALHPSTLRLLALPRFSHLRERFTASATARLDLHITLSVLSPTRAVIQSDLLLHSSRIPLLAPRTLSISLRFALDHLHLDVPALTAGSPPCSAPNPAVLALSFSPAAHLDSPAAPAYARTSLLASTGLIHAAFDPPSLLFTPLPPASAPLPLAHAST